MMRAARARLIVVHLFVFWPLLVNSRAHAQDIVIADARPRFLYASSPGAKPVEVEAGRVAALTRKVALDLDNVRLEDALDELSRQANVHFVYVGSVLPLDTLVRFSSESITVAAALTELLLGLRVDVVVSGTNQLAFVRRAVERRVPGRINGVVKESQSDRPVVAAQVFVEGTRRNAITDADGRYEITNVPPGRQRVTASSLGYRRDTQEVDVGDGATVTLDFALEISPTTLSELVVTATGEQRRVELGHVVGRIDADSIVKAAPVSSLSELLTARVPGLQVFQESGSVGGRVNVRIRGPNSLTHDNQPIVIIDGVRYTTQEKTRLFSNSSISDMEPTSPLNDLNPNDIESIDVVKGPSAATLYGTDAANGVIVITTKRGRTGPPRWNMYAKGSTTEIPVEEFRRAYWGWGTVNGVPGNASASCTLLRLADGSCTQQDSITVVTSALNDPQLTIFDSKPRWQYGMNVAGGRQDLRYYFSGDFEQATGPVRMPRALEEQLKEERGISELPEEWREPNAFNKLNLRSNINGVFGDRADVGVSLGYVHSNTRTLASGSRVYDVGHNAGNYSGGGGIHNPAEVFAQSTNEKVDRFVGSARGRWQPVRWFVTRATVGLDYTNSHRVGFVTRGDQGLFTGNSQGRADDVRRTQTLTTADLGAQATVRRGRLSARTGIGAQYVRILNSGFGTSGRGLPQGGKSPVGAADISVNQDHEESALLGGYVEETLGLNERFFLTGAIRVDGASTFGQDYEAALYPKLGASWLLSEEPFIPRFTWLDEVRLRYAFGASGKQPSPEAARPQLAPGTVVVGGQVVNSAFLFSPGNPNLRPERVREHEFGFDASVFSKRVTAEVTWFRRRTVDQHISELGPTGRGVIITNLGLTTQRGFEAALTGRVLDTRNLTWDLSVQHSDYTTLLEDLGSGTMVRSVFGGYVEGFPLGARFQLPLVGFADENGDGIIDASEIQLGDTAVYMGQSLPPRSQTLTSVFGLLNSRIRFSALLERKSGFTQVNPYACGNQTCSAAVDPGTSLAEQAATVAANRPGFFPDPRIENGDFIRLREVTAAIDLPEVLFRAVRSRRATLVVSARNLALWTDFSGADPEVGGGGRGGFATLPSIGIDPVAGGAAAGIPLGRVVSIRLDLGF